MSYLCTLIYAMIIMFRPQDWLFTSWLAYQPVTVVAIISLCALMVDLLTGQVTIPRKLPHLWLGIGVYFAIIMSHASWFYWWGIRGSFEEYGKKLIFYLLVLITINSVKKLWGLLALIVAAAVLMTVHCHLQISRGYGFGGQRPLMQLRFQDGEWIHTARAFFFGIFEDPNDTCTILVVAISLTLALFPRAMLPISIALSLFFVHGIDLTKSRGGQLGMLTVGVLLFHRLLSRKMFLIAGIGLVIAFTQVLPLAAKYGFVDKSALDRAIFWGEANYAFKSSPRTLLFGVGYAILSTDYMEKDRAVHNSFVECYAEIGTFGYAFWFTLVALSFAGCRYISRLQPEDRSDRWLKWFATLMVPALGGYFTSAYFLTRAHHIPTMLMMAISGILYRLTAERMGYKTLSDRLWLTGKKIWFYPALSLGSIVFIYFSIRAINALG